MPDELNVGISANAAGAITAFDGLADSVDRFDSSMGKLPNSLSNLSRQAEEAIIPHRTAHQALNLVTRQVSELAGASKVAQGPLRVFNDILFGLVSTGGGISIPFIAATAAIVGLSSAIRAMSANGEEANKEYDKLLEKVRALAPDSERAAQATLNQAKASLALLQAQLEVEKQTPTMGAKAAAAWHGVENATKAAATEAGKVFEATINPLKAMEVGAGATAASMGKIKSSAAATNPEIAALEKKIKDLDSAIGGATKGTDKLRAAQISTKLEAEKAFESMRADQIKYWVDLDKRTQEATTKTRSFFGLAKDQAQDYKQVASTAFQGAANAIGMSFAKMVMEGKNFGETAKALFVEVAEQAIARIIAVEIVDKGIQAAKVAFHGATQALLTVQEAAAVASRHGVMVATNTAAVVSFQAVAEAAAGAWGAILGPPGSIAAMKAEAALYVPLYPMVAAATGMDTMFDRPTRLLVGEGGQPERVTVTPASQGGGAKGDGGNTYISIGNISLPSVKSPRDFVEELARLVTQRIRGRGELSMLGKGIA